MSNVQLSQINSGVAVAYARATDTPVAVRSGATDELLSGIQEINPPPVAGGATLAVTAAMSGQPILLNEAAGTVATLPAATGSGNWYDFIVTVALTSAANKILPHSGSDYMQGLVIGENAGTCKSFASDGTTNKSIQMPYAGTQPSGGYIGDHFRVRDIAANKWQVTGAFQAGVTATTPFSTSAT